MDVPVVGQERGARVAQRDGNLNGKEGGLEKALGRYHPLKALLGRFAYLPLEPRVRHVSDEAMTAYTA